MMPKLPSHDDLVVLAKHSPEKLEELRSQLVESIIESAPEHMQRRLRGVQFQIDAQRTIHSNPLSACVVISQMMYDSISALSQALNGGIQHPSVEKQSETKILPFPALA